MHARTTVNTHIRVVWVGPSVIGDPKRHSYTHVVPNPKKQVRRCMEQPEDGYGLGELLVKLEVDAKIVKNWLDAK